MTLEDIMDGLTDAELAALAALPPDKLANLVYTAHHERVSADLTDDQIADDIARLLAIDEA